MPHKQDKSKLLALPSRIGVPDALSSSITQENLDPEEVIRGFDFGFARELASRCLWSPRSGVRPAGRRSRGRAHPGRPRTHGSVSVRPGSRARRTASVEA